MHNKDTYQYMKIIITGPKGSGKSTIGKAIAAKFTIPFVETDEILEELYSDHTGLSRTCREIVQEEGEAVFREWEGKAVKKAARLDWCIIGTGGGTMGNPSYREELTCNAVTVLLKADDNLLWERMQVTGLPPFLSGENPRAEYRKRVDALYQATEHRSDIVFTVTGKNQAEAADVIAGHLAAVISLKMFSPSTFGEILRVTTFGESHGKAVGAVLDGVPPGVMLSPDDIQQELDRRRPGQSRVTTPRNESDRVEILSGIFEGKTTGTPVCLVVYNKDQDSSKYEAIKDVFRPGHADFTFWKKFDIRDYRGGGRSSGRETIGRVAPGAVAKRLLMSRGVHVYAYADEIAGIRGEMVDVDYIEKNPVRAADPEMAPLMEKAIIDARTNHDSVGGMVRLVVTGMPAGCGDPVFYKLDARLAMAMVSIGAVKGVEFGTGFQSAKMKGSTQNDQMRNGEFLSNNAGGILGGISTGEDILVRVAVRPTPSIFREQQTIDIQGNNRTIAIEGRHDPCIVPRIIPVVESMAALVCCDALMIQDKIQSFKEKGVGHDGVL